MLLRKNLKAGDVFRYRQRGELSFSTYFVPPMENPPSNLICSLADGVSMECPVELVYPKPEPATPALTSQVHYTTGGIEAIDAIEAWGLNFRLANVVKYVARCGRKPGVEAKDDLVKARNYLSREIAALEGRRAWD